MCLLEAKVSTTVKSGKQIRLQLIVVKKLQKFSGLCLRMVKCTKNLTNYFLLKLCQSTSSVLYTNHNKSLIFLNPKRTRLIHYTEDRLIFKTGIFFN